MIRSAAMMLSELEGINFIGYIEGRDVARDVVDVVVCDGFVGNIVLKTMEGSVGLVVESVNAALEHSWRAKLGLWLAKPALKGVFREKLDPAAYGGAPLLGLSYVAIKCHGSSTGRAIMNGIKVAKTFVDRGVVGKLSTALSSLDVRVDGVETVDGTTWSKVFEKRGPERRKKRVENGEGAAAEGNSGSEQDS